MRLTIGKKLALGFGAILVLLAVNAVLSYQKTAEVERKESYILNVCFPTIDNLTNWERDLSHTQENGRQFVLAATQQYKREKAQKTVDEA
ncbi:MAG: MCP four helix bundle domain-containing protein, partial [Candidatus Acidiferrales bacterium]